MKTWDDYKEHIKAVDPEDRSVLYYRQRVVECTGAVLYGVNPCDLAAV